MEQMFEKYSPVLNKRKVVSFLQLSSFQFLFTTLPLFICVLFVQPSFSQKSKDISKFKVRSVTYTITEIVDGKEFSYKDSYVVFDKSGNPVEEIFYDKSGKEKKKETYVYNKNNKVIEHVIYNPNGSVKKKELCKYNSENEKTEELVLDGSGKQIKKETIIFNIHGDKEEERIEDKNGKKRIIYTYDKNGMRTARKEYDDTGKLIFSKKYEYQF